MAIVVWRSYAHLVIVSYYLVMDLLQKSQRDHNDAHVALLPPVVILFAVWSEILLVFAISSLGARSVFGSQQKQIK